MNKNWIFLLLPLLWACDQAPTEPTVDDLPFLGMQNASVPENVSTGKLNFELRLSEASNEAVSVLLRTQNGSARAGDDFVALNGETLNIPAGETSATLEVEIVNDEEFETDETFELRISEVRGARVSDSSATGTIRNDDERDTSIGDAGYTSPTSYAGYTLVWQDEFNDGQLSSDWTYEIGDGCPGLCGWGNNELQTYTNRPENLYFEDGKLVIEARQEAFNGSNYTSTRIITKGQQSFQYGRIDIRAKLPYGQGLWPALWMLGDNIDQVSWPACGEIDIMELVGHEPNVVHGTCHWANASGVREQFGGSFTLRDGIFWDEFHVFSIVWEENSIIWYVDDRQYHVLDTSPQNLDEFRNSFFFIFNIAVGGDWPGSPNATTVFPQKMAVDYVRVFQPE